MATTYCEPDSGPGHTLQILTHGIGFDRSYWDLPANNYNYSYVARAVDEHAYSTLTWDRLGVGQSTHPQNAVNETQLFLEVAALEELTNHMAASCKTATPFSKSYDNIVHVGHSFGSSITYSLVNEYPDISDGIVLTGFSQVPDFLAQFALGGNFVPVNEITALKDQYAAGYVAPANKAGVHINFFAPGDFDPAILDYSYEHGQPNTIGEILTVGAGTDEKNQFAGPVMIITGGKSF